MFSYDDRMKAVLQYIKYPGGGAARQRREDYPGRILSGKVMFQLCPPRKEEPPPQDRALAPRTAPSLRLLFDGYKTVSRPDRR